MNYLRILLVLLMPYGAWAQPANSLLWKVSGNGLSQPSYLFGTIHMIPKDDYFFTETMQNAFNQCHTFVLEADMFGLSLQEQINMAQQVILPDNKTLASFMDSTHYMAFRQMVVDSIGIKAAKFDNKYNRIKPFFLMAFLLQEYVGDVKMYEDEFHKMAKKQNKTIVGLETVQYQLDLANQLTIEDQLEGISDFAEFKKYGTLVTIYKQQQLDSIYAMSLSDYNTPHEQAFLNDFLYNRNKNWVPIIDGLIKSQPCFIAIGAMHLPGKGGLIELLQQQGYTVVPE